MLTRLAVAVVLLGLVLVPAGALASPQDIATTHAYVQANLAFAQASEAKVKAVQASTVKLTRKFSQECPNAGAGSPQNEDTQKLSYEAAGALWSVTYGAIAGPIKAFARAVKPLHWSNPKITRSAQDYAKNLKGLATLKLPDLCGDVRAWSATGFRTIPPKTLGFDRKAEALEAHTIPAHLLAPFEQSTDRSTIKLTTSLESKLEGIEMTVGFDDWNHLLETVGLKE